MSTRRALCVLCGKTASYDPTAAIGLGRVDPFSFMHRDVPSKSLKIDIDGRDAVLVHEACVLNAADAVLAHKSRVRMGQRE